MSAVRRLVALCCAFIAATALLSTPARAIYRGYPATASQFPWFVEITYDGKPNCGGSLIRADVVVTAAHCVVESDYDQARIGVSFRWGTAQRSDAPVRLPIRVGDYRPGPGGGDNINDIALIPLVQRRNEPVIPLVNAKPPIGTWMTAIGFGSTQPFSLYGPAASSLQGMALQRVSAANLPCSWPATHPTEMCVTGGNSQINHGDSGGPLMVQTAGGWRLAGISQLTFWPAANGKLYSAAGSIADQLGWISRTLQSIPSPSTPPATTPSSPAPTPANPAPTPAPSAPAPTPSPSPPSPPAGTPAPAPTPPPAATLAYQVIGTCLDGACGLKVRSGPGYTNYAQIGTVYDGNTVQVTCQASGEMVGPSRATGRSSAIWDRLNTGGWVSDLYVNTPAIGDWTPGIPRC